jgi:hypothetical protein
MRDYDPTTGRYIQADPLGLVDGASVYGYAIQSPMRWTDPTGEAIFIPVLLGASRLVALAGAAATAYDLWYEACRTEDGLTGREALSAVVPALLGGGSVVAVRQLAKRSLRADLISSGYRMVGRGLLKVSAKSPSVSERAAADFVARLGRNVELRDPVGRRGSGGTSDLLVNGSAFDVYTPTTSNPSRTILAIAKKNDQATGIVLDLSNSSVTPADLGDVLRRVNGAGARNISEIIVMPR